MHCTPFWHSYLPSQSDTDVSWRAGWVVRLRVWICTLTVRFATDFLVSTFRLLHRSQLIVEVRVLRHPFLISIRR
jgi:hypothetical protein